MSEIEAKEVAAWAPQDDEEEFEIIQEDGHDEEGVREPAGSASDDGAVRMTYVEKSVPPSECTDVGDLGDAFDGKSVCSDAPSSNAARLLESIYATPYADSAHVDKLVEMLRGEYEQNRSVLENISKMVADLYKEKHDNAELRVELEGYKQRCEKLHETIGDLHDKLIEKDDAASKRQEDYERVLLKMDALKFNQDEKEAVICELQEAFYNLSAENESANNTLAKAQEELDALRLREKEKDRKLTVLAEEMEKKCCELESKSAENADLKHAMEEMQKELMALKKETVNQAEIIRIVQEENTEATRAYTEARKEFREKLDAMEQHWLRRQVTRNENVILTPNTSSSKTGDQTESLEPSGSRNGHIAVVGLPGTTLKKDSELAIKFMDEERMKLPAMQQDLSHLDTNFRHKLVEEWVSKSYDVDYCFSKLRELVDDPKQKYREIIQQSMQVILDLSNVRQENNLLRLHLDEKNAELQSLKAQVDAYKAAAAKNPIQID